jgi:hypothetical protein
MTTDEVPARWDDVREGAHDQARNAVHESRPALVRVGGAFMTSPHIAAAARPLALTPLALYFQGRAGALGQLTATSVARLFGAFSPRVVEPAFGGREPLVPPETAATAFARASAAWGQERLTGLPTPTLARLAELAEAVVDLTPADALPLVAAWRAQPRPDQAAARAAHAAFLLRELRGALHFAALALHGLPVVQAVLADPDAGPERLRFYGWTREEVVLLSREMDPQDRHERREASERDTDDALTARMLAALDPDEVSELAELLHAALQEARSAKSAT